MTNQNCANCGQSIEGQPRWIDEKALCVQCHRNMCGVCHLCWKLFKAPDLQEEAFYIVPDNKIGLTPGVYTAKKWPVFSHDSTTGGQIIHAENLKMFRPLAESEHPKEIWCICPNCATKTHNHNDMNNTHTNNADAQFKKPSHQQILAEHVFQLHEDITKIAMQTWRCLMREEVSPTQIEQAKNILVEMEKRIQYAKNCCYWIQDAQQKKPEPKNQILSPSKHTDHDRHQ